MVRKRCFVISPIGPPQSEIRKHADTVFRGIMLPAAEKLRLEGLEIEPVRSDQMQEPGKISEQMFREIFSSDACVAVLTFLNANVFYELAVAQCAFRPVVALLKESDTLPFDVADLRIVSYELDPLRLVDRRDAEELAAHLRTMFQPGWQPPDLFGPAAPKLWAAMRDPYTIQRLIETSRPKPLPAGDDATYGVPGDPSRQIIIRTGDVRYVRNVDVIVSSENTDLQLARYYDPSVSGTLRYLDATRELGGNVTIDSLNDTLTDYLARNRLRLPVMPGTVLPIPTTGLRSAGVRYVFLAASVRGDGIGRGYSSVDAEIENCVVECFRVFQEKAAEEQLESMLFPVFGAGTAKQDPEQAARSLLRMILIRMRDTVTCKRVHILAWVDSHRRALRNAAAELSLDLRGQQ